MLAPPIHQQTYALEQINTSPNSSAAIIKAKQFRKPLTIYIRN